MAAATSATMTVDPPAVKKRGRPRKVVDEGAVASEKSAVRKASTKAKPTSKAKTMDAMKEKKKTLTRVSDYKTKKETPPTQTQTAQATPATPTSSKILDEVKATGAFTKPAATANPTADVAPPSPPQQEPEQPFIPPIPGPAPVAPIQQPLDDAPSKPVIPPTTASPSERANIIPPATRGTTIPLPRNPLTAPSPTTSNPKPRVNFAKPAPSASRHPPKFPTRIIEPTLNTKLPPKYRKAARQVTSIIVGIPIIIVVGYELYGRWKRQISVKFEERARRDEAPRS
jgi:hypothetical protein